jgi:DNA-binding MarR family transcriptional regulator
MCALDRALSTAHGLTVSDFEVLQELCTAGGQYRNVRMSELGERVHLSQSAFSRLITRLEHAGLVERSPCDSDRRSAWTKITKAGVQRYLEAKPTQRAILREQTSADASSRSLTADGGDATDTRPLQPGNAATLR